MKSSARKVARWITSFSALRQLFRLMGTQGLLPEAVWQRLPVAGDFTRRLPDGRSFRYAAYPGEIVGRYLYWNGKLVYEPETTLLIIQYAQKARMFVDIGAHTGYFVLLASTVNPYLHTVAFEPLPLTRSLLVRNVELNNLQTRCEIRPEAVAKARGKARLYLPDGHSVASAGASLKLSDSLPSIEVDVISLDDFWDNRGPCDLVKIDVEGFEHQVLLGMQHLMEKWRPRIVFECLSDESADVITELLHQHHYRIYKITADGLELQERVTPDQNLHNRNFLALPQDKYAS